MFFLPRFTWEYQTFESGHTRFLDVISTSFLSSVFRDPKLREEISSLLGSRTTRHGFAFAIREPSFEVVRLLTSFRHGALLSDLIVRKKITDISRNS